METVQKFLEAVIEGNIALVEELVARDPSLVNARSESGVAAVLLAIYYNEPTIAELLIAKGADLNIFEASAAGKLDRVRDLLDENPSLLNAYAPDGFQPLGLASFFGHGPVVELLLSRGAEVNSPSANAQRVMPLHSAVANQHIEIARALLDHGADVNAKQADEFTPLHEAAQNGQLEMVKLLLAYGANKAAKKTDGQTAHAIAFEKGYQEVAELLDLPSEIH